MEGAVEGAPGSWMSSTASLVEMTAEREAAERVMQAHFRPLRRRLLLLLLLRLLRALGRWRCGRRRGGGRARAVNEKRGGACCELKVQGRRGG